MRLMFFDDLRAERIVRTRTTLNKWIEEEGISLLAAWSGAIASG